MVKVPFSQLHFIENLFWRYACSSRTYGLSNDVLGFFISNLTNISTINITIQTYGTEDVVFQCSFELETQLRLTQ